MWYALLRRVPSRMMMYQRARLFPKLRAVIGIQCSAAVDYIHLNVLKINVTVIIVDVVHVVILDAAHRWSLRINAGCLKQRRALH